MLVPTGTFVSLNLPSAPVSTLTSGWPLTFAPQQSHDTLVENASTGPFGMYTRAL